MRVARFIVETLWTSDCDPRLVWELGLNPRCNLEIQASEIVEENEEFTGRLLRDFLRVVTGLARVPLAARHVCKG